MEIFCFGIYRPYHAHGHRTTCMNSCVIVLDLAHGTEYMHALYEYVSHGLLKIAILRMISMFNYVHLTATVSELDGRQLSASQEFRHHLGPGRVFCCNQGDAIRVVDSQHALPLLLGDDHLDDTTLLLAHSSVKFGRCPKFDTAGACGLVISTQPLHVGHQISVQFIQFLTLLVI